MGEDGNGGKEGGRTGRKIKSSLEVWGLGHFLQNGYSKVCTLDRSNACPLAQSNDDGCYGG